MTEYRAHTDFSIRFANGGGLEGSGFRLDLPGPSASRDEVAALLVQHLGLALVGSVELSDLEVVEEPHRGTRGVGRAPAGAGERRRIIDLSHRIRAGMTTYPGLPGPDIQPHLSREQSRAHYDDGVEFQIDSIRMVGNTGTYLDSPFHRYASGHDLAELDLDRLVDLPAEVFHLTDTWTPDRRGIEAVTLADRDLRDAAVLLHTGHDRTFGTPDYAIAAPFLSAGAAQLLADAQVAVVGIDSVNIDDIDGSGARPAHSILLAAGIPLVEHLTGLAGLPPQGSRFSAAPPAIEDVGTFSVRAFAVLP